MKRWLIFPLFCSVVWAQSGVLLSGNVKLTGNVKLSTAPSIPDINCIFTPSQNCPSFTPSGDPYSTPGKFAGYADPWLRQDPNHTTHFWFGYSWPTVCTGTPPCNSTGTKPINLHLAEDTGSGFNFVTDLYTTAEITNPETGSTKDQTSYEIMDAIPQDVGGGLTDWYGVLLNYLVPPGGVGPVQTDTRRLELAGCQDTSGGGAAGPSCLPGATQQYLGGSQTNTTYWPISQNLTTLSGLSACVGWDEPTLWYDSGADNLYLFAGCSNYSGYYQFSTHAPASHLGTWTWAFVAGSQLGTHADANAICSKYFSNCGATNFLNACEIANSHVSGMVWVCDVQHPIDSSHNFTSGVVAIQLATLSPPSFTYASAGLPLVLAIATCTQCVADGPGAPAYEPNYTGGMPIAALMTNCIAGAAGCSTQGGYFIQVVGTGLRP